MHIVVFATVPSEEVGMKIAKEVVEKRLAACANLTGGITSVYWWENKVQEDKEMLLIMKTKLQLFNKLEDEIRKNHPYEVPEIIALPLVTGFKPYLSWISKETQAVYDDANFRGFVF
jgi:periplasmic divalent cation tolerance protein